MLTLTFCVFLLMGLDAYSGALQVQHESLKGCGLDHRCVRRSLCENPDVQWYYKFNSCDGEDVCCDIMDIVKDSGKYDGFSCGYRNINGVGETMATSSKEVEFGEFPWIVAILKIRNTPQYLQTEFYCGGSLIHPRVVLTAAHNVIQKAPSDFRVRAGEWDPHSKSEPFPHQDSRVGKIVIPDNYSSYPLQNDGALLILETPFVIAPHINTVCLPDANTRSFSGTCFVAGWGTKEFQTTNFSQKLKKIDLQVLPTDQCNDLLRRTRLGTQYTLHESFICAGGEAGKDACTGDGGSALMCPMPFSQGRYYQAGIVSWGIGCGDRDVPGVYTNVAVFRSWIERVFTLENIIE